MLAAVIEGTTLVSRPPVSALERLSPGCFFSLAYASGACVQLLPDPCTYLILEVPKVSAPRCVISGPRLKAVRSVPAEAMQVDRHTVAPRSRFPADWSLHRAMGGTSRVSGGCLGPLCERACRT